MQTEQTGVRREVFNLFWAKLPSAVYNMSHGECYSDGSATYQMILIIDICQKTAYPFLRNSKVAMHMSSLPKRPMSDSSLQIDLADCKNRAYLNSRSSNPIQR